MGDVEEKKDFEGSPDPDWIAFEDLKEEQKSLFKGSNGKSAFNLMLKQKNQFQMGCVDAIFFALKFFVDEKTWKNLYMHKITKKVRCYPCSLTSNVGRHGI